VSLSPEDEIHFKAIMARARGGYSPAKEARRLEAMLGGDPTDWRAALDVAEDLVVAIRWGLHDATRRANMTPEEHRQEADEFRRYAETLARKDF
jgi:hypothetical protein